MNDSIRGWAISITAVAIAAPLIVAVPAVVQAQSPTIRVSVPFEFHVGKVTLPPGTYMVQSKGAGSALSISDRIGHAATAITYAIPNSDPKSPSKGALKFKMYEGDQYFLSEVRWSGYSTALALEKSSPALKVGQVPDKPTTKTIAAK